jgi:uncharacterized protein (DUF1330 family)
MSCYFIAQIDIRDEAEYASYLAGYDAVFDRHDGEVLAVDDAVTVLEGDWPFSRTVVIRFPDGAALDRWYRSPEYQALAEHRRRGSMANIVAVQGR